MTCRVEIVVGARARTRIYIVSTKMRDAQTTTMDAMSDAIVKLDAFRNAPLELQL